MSYDKKIAIIESNISELEEDLNVVNIRFAEKIETAIEIINDVIDDINSIDEKMTKKNIEKYERKLELIREKMKLPIEMDKKFFYLELESFRIQSNIIRKISPRTSDLINSKINEVEKIHLKLIKNWENWREKGDKDKEKEKEKERKKITEDIFKTTTLIGNIIDISRNCIKDTIDTIRGK